MGFGRGVDTYIIKWRYRRLGFRVMDLGYRGGVYIDQGKRNILMRSIHTLIAVDI